MIFKVLELGAWNLHASLSIYLFMMLLILEYKQSANYLRNYFLCVSLLPPLFQKHTQSMFSELFCD